MLGARPFFFDLMQTDTDTRETAPPGFEHVVKGLKGKPGVDNPFAVAWSMKDKGIEPTVGGKECDAEALFKRYQFECGRESNGAGALGALMRPGTKPVAEARRASISTSREARRPGAAWKNGGEIGDKRDTATSHQGALNSRSGASAPVDFRTVDTPLAESVPGEDTCARTPEHLLAPVPHLATPYASDASSACTSRGTFDSNHAASRAVHRNEDNNRPAASRTTVTAPTSSSAASRGTLFHENTARTIACFTPLREALTTSTELPPRSARVRLITAGKGNVVDANFYSDEALQRSYTVFEGKPCFVDHPSRSQEQDLPERSVLESCGWFSDVGLSLTGATTAVEATLHFSKNTAGDEALKLVESALEYARQYPSSSDVFCGFSINASGPSHSQMIDGDPWNWVDAISSCFSVDLVTRPARGGRALDLREAEAIADSQRFRRSLTQALRAARWRGKIRQAIAARHPEAAHAA